jgi:hypothetical protein
MAYTILDGFAVRTILTQSSPYGTNPKELVRKQISLDLSLVASYSKYIIGDIRTSNVSLRDDITEVWLTGSTQSIIINMTPAEFAALLPGGVALPSIGLYSQTQQGPIVTNTTTESTIVGSGVGSLTVPANTFEIGDSYHGKIGGVISTLNNHEITITAKADGIILATTGLISLEAATTQSWEMEIDFTIAAIGALGTVKSNGNFIYNRNTGSYEGVAFNDTEILDTTIDLTLDILVQWNQASTSDIIYTHQFTLYKTY